MPRKILVTGGAGAVGAPLVHALVARGDDVRVLDNCSRGDRSRLDDIRSSVHFIKGDITQPPYVNWAVRDRDCIIHLAAVNGTHNFYERPYEVLQVGVAGMLNLLEACRRYNVREFLLASSSEVYQTPGVIPTPESVPLSIPDPQNARYSYAASKIVSELLALHCPHLDRALVVRPHNIYGPQMPAGHVIPDLIERALRLRDGEELPIHGTGEDTRAFCHIDDAVAGFLAVLDKGEHRGIYNIGNEEEVKIWRLAQLILTYAGKTQNGYAYAAASPAGGTARRCPDVTKLRGLDWEPKIAFTQGLWETVQWHMAEAAKWPNSKLDKK